MRKLREHMITEPNDRYERISTLIESFHKAGVLNEWNLSVQQTFTTIKAKQLYHAKVLDPKNNSVKEWADYE